MLHSRIEGQGLPLLIIHGFLGMSDNWKSLGSLYAAEGFQTHMLDMRNHGKSFHSDDFNYEVMCQDVLEYCQELNLHHLLRGGRDLRRDCGHHSADQGEEGKGCGESGARQKAMLVL